MPTLSRAHEIASIHLASINASRKKCGLALFTADELAQEFADLDRQPPRATVGSPRTNPQAAVDSMWGGIVARLNTTLPSSRAPIGSGRTSPASSGAAGRVDAAVDWDALAHRLNTEAGLKPPARRAR
jgi:hypothetical protein